MTDKRDYDIVIYGATGFTGALIAEYLHQFLQSNNEHKDKISWAIAGRSPDKLGQLAHRLNLPADVGHIIADSNDETALHAMAKRARVICSSVGPYQLYGDKLLQACIHERAAYVDLCGEPGWMRQKIDEHHIKAQETGTQICFSCGFDSVPFDLGAYFLQKAYKKKFGHNAPHIRGRVRTMAGTFSGGTAASLHATMASIKDDPTLLPILASSFGLTPGFTGAKQPEMTAPHYDELINGWIAPFIMAPINTKNIHRTNFLTDFAYGEQFLYDEHIITGPGEAGKAAAIQLSTTAPFPANDTPKPGEGPSAAEREAGHYDMIFLAQTPSGGQFNFSVKGDRDPGYGSTSKIIAQAALTIATGETADKSGGIWTPAALMAEPLLKRITAYSGLTFSKEPQFLLAEEVMNP